MKKAQRSTGSSWSEAVRRIAPTVFGCPVGEYVADGAARQVAWVLSGGPRPPSWTVGQVEVYEADAVPAGRERYATARANVRDRG
jgi:xylulokinase